MKRILAVLLFCIMTASVWARIGDTIDELRKRYGTAERLHDEIGGLTVVEFTKPPYVFKFQLLDLKAEGVEIYGIISQEEAEVLIARNVPSQKFSLDLNTYTPYAKEFAFWKAYIFTDDSTAYYYSLKGEVSSGIKILTPKMATYNEWREKSEKTQKINDANLMIDSIEKPDPSTALQSDRNTAAASKVVNGTDPTLGGQEGKKNDSLTMQNSQFSPNPASPPPSARLSPSAAKPPSQAKPNPSQDADDASDVPMPTPPEICGDRSAVSWGAQMGQDASFASTGTAISRYQRKLYLGIGSRWNLKVQQTMAKIGANRVVISFFVNPDGSISQIHIVEGDRNSLLGQISGDAINQSSSLIGPFPDALLFRYPKGFPWQLAFRVK